MINAIRPLGICKPPYSDTYVVKVVYMMGDADSYVTKEIAMTDEQVIAFKNLLDHTKWDRDLGYQHGELYEVLVETFIHEEEIEIEELFAVDPDAWGYGRLESFFVLWYDKDSNPHNVEFYWQ